MKSKIIISILIVFASIGLAAQNQMALLPIHNNGIDKASAITFEQLLRQEIINKSGYNIISKSMTEEVSGTDYCMDADCGASIGRALNVDKVVSCSLSKLGDKVVIQFMKVNVATQSIDIIDSVVSSAIEDLEIVATRIAISISNNRKITESAEIGAITETEEKGFIRRKAKQYTGISFGYLYPTDEYDNIDNEFSIDFRTGFEMEKYAVGMLSGFRRGFAINIYMNYLLTKTDFCPYLGGALGFHWVHHSDKIKGYEEDGLEFIASTGIRLFRTYNFQVLINLDYSYVLNEYHDQACVLTIGLLK